MFTITETGVHVPPKRVFTIDRNDRSPWSEIRIFALKYVQKSFERACKNAGIVDFTFHDLRHTFASHLVMSGVDLNTVRELLGHKTLAMTLRYSHLSPAHRRDAVEVLDRYVDTPVDTGSAGEVQEAV